MIYNLNKDIDKLMEFHENGTPSSKFREEYDSICIKYLNELKESDRKKCIKESSDKAKKPSLSEIYPYLTNRVKSTVYTPISLASELCDATPVNQGDSLLDCSSGTGNLLFPFVKKYRNEIAVTANDTDKTATKIAETELLLNHGFKKLNILNSDFLDIKGSFDIIIGNPPYSGHKDITEEIKLRLRKEYSDVYSNKGDLYYAFFKKGFDLLNPGGRLAFIVSRYFLEAESAIGLRRFILNNFRILFIHDYYGERPFGAGVDPCIIILEKNTRDNNVEYSIPVIREDIGSFETSSLSLNPDSMKLLTKEELKLIKVIEGSCRYKLGSIGRFAQGIITGYDRVFIKTLDEAIKEGIETDLLVPWIKSKDLLIKSENENDQKYLVYPDKRSSEMTGFLNYAHGYKPVLSIRREVVSGTRKYYELTWGRKKDDFIKCRILFPYKANDSSFVLRENVFHSADVYSLFLNDENQYGYILTILNSPVYKKYIKTKLKKLGKDLYEYYPHRLKEIWIPDAKDYPDPELFLEQMAEKLKES